MTMDGGQVPDRVARVEATSGDDFARPRDPPARSVRRGASLRGPEAQPIPSDPSDLEPRPAGGLRFDPRPRAPRQATGGLRIGRSRPIHPLALIVAGAIVFGIFYVSWAIFRVRDVEQIPMLSTGFLVLALAFGTLAVWAGGRMWGAASRAMTRQAMLLALFGGASAFAAIGLLTLAVLLTLVWRA
jgi:hypothetical protein